MLARLQQGLREGQVQVVADDDADRVDARVGRELVHAAQILLEAVAAGGVAAQLLVGVDDRGETDRGSPSPHSVPAVR
ncbi:hypothetical protein GCM10025883_37480 [Mobilicoccus caccae]|uniref:Uncharacterized protein n=1 Tax=Mobilicoccus caccae TaxID=1859295 RepID=A0ABQ6IYE4_9MICO|nr:hypothetical protein GCM10025883_37480 [Mobilicoccus caccae]